MNNLVHLTYRHMTCKISKVSADPRRGRSKGGTYVPRHRVLRPSLRRCDRTLLVYAEARHRTYVALDVSREKKRKWGSSWLGRRRTASSLARKELPSLPLAPGRSLMMQLNSNRRIDSAGIMILSWSETERGEARTIISPQARSSRQNHRHSMAALPSERFVAAHRIATPCISCLNPRTTPSPPRANRARLSKREEKWHFLGRRRYITRDDVNCVCGVVLTIRYNHPADGYASIFSSTADAIPTTRDTRLEGLLRLELCRKVGDLPVRLSRSGWYSIIGI